MQEQSSLGTRRTSNIIYREAAATVTVQFIATANHSGVSQFEMGGACGTYGGEEQCVQDLVGKPEVNRLFGRPRHRWEGY
jgi:hypothetical protein